MAGLAQTCMVSCNVTFNEIIEKSIAEHIFVTCLFGISMLRPHPYILIKKEQKLIGKEMNSIS